MARKITEIDRNSPVPAYFQIETDLKERIARQEWAESRRLPGEIELAKQYNVSRITLRQALAELEKDGLINKIVGRGTFINLEATPYINELNYSVVSRDQLSQSPHSITAEILEQHLVTDLYPDVCKNLNLEKNDSAVYIKRLFLMNNKPIAFGRSYISAKLVPGLEDLLLVRNSISLSLSNEYNLNSKYVEDYIEAVRATQSESLLLGCSYGCPLIVIKATSYLANKSPLEYSNTYWSGDSVRFHLSLRHSKDGFITD